MVLGILLAGIVGGFLGRYMRQQAVISEEFEQMYERLILTNPFVEVDGHWRYNGEVAMTFASDFLSLVSKLVSYYGDEQPRELLRKIKRNISDMAGWHRSLLLTFVEESDDGGLIYLYRYEYSSGHSQLRQDFEPIIQDHDVELRENAQGFYVRLKELADSIRELG